MTFRPRYSLLTLLLVTALVAGGVKLWHGPHHVVERPTVNEEDEYTFTRDWDGSRIIHGARVKRSISDGKTCFVGVQYYQVGIAFPQVCLILIDTDGGIKEHEFPSVNKMFKDERLTEMEQQDWKQVVDREREEVLMSRHGVSVLRLMRETVSPNP